MIIESTKNEVVFRQPASIPVEDLQGIINLFEFTEIDNKSTVSQKEVHNLVKSIKRSLRKNTY